MNNKLEERVRANEVNLENIKETIPRIFEEIKALPALISKKFSEYEERDTERRKGENFETRIKCLESWKIKFVAIATVISVILVFSKDFLVLAIQKIVG